MIGEQPVESLISQDEAWPLVQEWAAARGARILPGEAAERAETLRALQVTTHSVLGSLAYHCGGIVVDDGWLRLLGGGQPAGEEPGLPSLAEMNGLGERGQDAVAPGLLVVAYDVLGGLFGVNAGALPAAQGEIAYFGPDTLEWVPLEAGHATFVEWALTTGLDDFAGHLRWRGWADEVRRLTLDQGMTAYPPPWSHEGRDLGAARRAPAPIVSIWASQATAAKGLAD
ncbi:DUF2625 family protein [Austwickia chelonae]|uniref:DUF2625 family protein n=1 Tax=Austwickia chelonae TaxID=100225 RepID=UPI000E259103|nr:DUF2625 family protein [Austwickia chelonae]